MSFFKAQPYGFTLIRKDGTVHNRIRGDLIPADTLVVIEDGRYFVRTGHEDDDYFLEFEEGFKSFEYKGSGE